MMKMYMRSKTSGKIDNAQLSNYIYKFLANLSIIAFSETFIYFCFLISVMLKRS